MSTDVRDGRTWTVVVPIKPPAVGKSRLAPFAGAGRARLALAMALDTVTAALACPRTLRVVAVTDDGETAGRLRRLGATVVPDRPRRGLNPAVEFGAASIRGADDAGDVAALSADLPALRPAELDDALGQASVAASAFVADAATEGTTLFCATSGTAFTPRFGPRSRAAHLAAGAVEIAVAAATGLRRDVDTEADLRAAVRLGVGPHTRAVLRELGER